MRTQTVRTLVAGCIFAGFAVGCSPGEQGSGDPGAPPDQAAEVLAIPSPVDRLLRWSALLEHASQEDVSSLRDAIAKAALDVGDPELVVFAMWWARFDPNAALAWTSAEWRAQSNFAIGQIFRMWAHADPEAAFKAIGQVPELRQDAAFDAVVTGWHESGKPGLVEYVQSIPGDAIRQRVGESLARHLVLALGTEAAMR